VSAHRDVKDLGRAILAVSAGSQQGRAEYSRSDILVSEELFTGDARRSTEGKLVGSGGQCWFGQFGTSILARALGIPRLMVRLGSWPITRIDGLELIVLMANHGEVYSTLHREIAPAIIWK